MSGATDGFTYVVLSHTDPTGLLRLVRRIVALSPAGHVLVRYDQPGLVSPAEVRAAGGQALVSDIPARWGAWSLAEAMIEAFRVARRSYPTDYYVLISGQDYPVRDLRAWEESVRESGADALFAPIAKTPDDHRYRWWIVRKPRLRPRLLDRAVGYALWRLGQVTAPILQLYQGPHEDVDGRYWIGLRRRHRGPMTPTKCSQWMTLSRTAVDEVLRTDAQRPDLRAYFAGVRIPDENYIQSLVHASPRLRIAHAPTSALHMPPGASNPDWLDAAGMRGATRSGAPFARKVPPDVARDVLAIADEASTAPLSASAKARVPGALAPPARAGRAR